MVLASALCVAFLGLCVRIVPGDAPSTRDSAVDGASGAPLIVPVQGVPPSALIDTFTQARASGARPHDAIDIMAGRGSAVLAAADGRIEKLFWSDAGGRTIYERSIDGRRIYYYAHLDGYAPGLREGQTVSQGMKIASVGSSGNADPSAPHLHFAVHMMMPGDAWHSGRAINPFPLLVPSR